MTSPCLVERLYGRYPRVKRRFCRLLPYLYEYQESTNSWISIPQMEGKKNEAMEYDFRLTCELSFNIVGDTIVVVLSKGWIRGFNEGWFEFEIVIFQVHSSKKVSSVLVGNNHQSGSEYSLHSFKTHNVIGGEKCYGTINLTASDWPITDYTKKKIFLHGFTLITGISHFFYWHLDPKYWTQVGYHSLSQRDPVKKCVSFKLKSNIFVIGLFEDLNFDYYGHPYWRCDRFDIEKDEYQKSCHLISSYVKQIFSATTDSSESYALILTDSGLLTFTEDHGFKYEGFFRINRDSFRDSIRFIDSESDLSDFVSWESSAILRPCFASSKSSLFPIG